jgi:pantoate--beta-alanine ligase
MPAAKIKVVSDVKALRRAVARWRAAGETIALVPTMGALHDGHVSLVRAAIKKRAKVIASIFVNPTQFAPTEDFSKYPRTFEADCALLKANGCDLVYAPTPEIMYPEGFHTTVTLSGPAKVGLEDRFRPTHFDGVATIVAKLFTQCAPDLAIFGEKDFQQLMVVKQMARDLDLPVQVIGAKTIRETDGLAMSSRNRYLSPDERQTAAAVPAALKACAAAIRAGADAAKAAAAAAEQLTQAGFEVDYLEARDAETLEAARSGRPMRLLVAAKLGKTRLIDNMAV